MVEKTNFFYNFTQFSQHAHWTITGLFYHYKSGIFAYNVVDDNPRLWHKVDSHSIIIFSTFSQRIVEGVLELHGLRETSTTY